MFRYLFLGILKKHIASGNLYNRRERVSKMI